MGSKRNTRSKHTVILEAANEIFLREGFDMASMDAIANAAGVSKQTVYNHFDGKEDLFRAFVRTRCESMSAAFDKPFLDEHNTPEEVLTAFGEGILGIILSPDAMRLRRLLQNEGSRHPELAEIFYQQGPDLTANRLANYLADQNIEGILAVREPRLAAEQFIAMLAGHLRIRHLIGLTSPPSNSERQRYVANAVQLFLDGARIKPGTQ